MEEILKIIQEWQKAFMRAGLPISVNIDPDTIGVEAWSVGKDKGKYNFESSNPTNNTNEIARMSGDFAKWVSESFNKAA